MAKMEKGIQVPLLRSRIPRLGKVLGVAESAWRFGCVWDMGDLLAGLALRFGLFTSKRLSMYGVGVLILDGSIY